MAIPRSSPSISTVFSLAPLVEQLGLALDPSAPAPATPVQHGAQLVGERILVLPLRRALAAVLVATVVVAGATTPVGDRLWATDGGHLWSGSPQPALTHGTRSDLQTLQEVRARGKLTAAGLPDFLTSAREGLACPPWRRGIWSDPELARPPHLALSNHRSRGPPGLGSSPVES